MTFIQNFWEKLEISKWYSSRFRFPRGFDIYKEPFEGYSHRPKFLRQEELSQYAVKNSCPDVTWNLYGYPMPEVSFKFEGNDIEMGDKYSFSYIRNGVVSLQVCKISMMCLTLQGDPMASCNAFAFPHPSW